MEKRARAIIVIIIAVIFIVAGYRFYDYVIKENYLIDANTNCDPKTESCFVADCSSSDPECDQTPYKKAELLRSEAPRCLLEHTCENFSCPSNSSSCSITYCIDGETDDGEVCYNSLPTPDINE